jgi:hypothetical protein
MGMNVWKIFLYSLLPMGQLLMRMIEFNGSLDKPYLLFPLLLIPPFSFIPVTLGYFGYIKKLNKGAPIDIYVLLPIIARFIFILLVSQIESIGMLFLQIGIVLAFLFSANMIRLYTTRKCDKTSFWGRTVKGTFDSMAQFGVGVMTVFLIQFIPFIGQILGLLINLGIPYLSQFIESIVWGIGLTGGYMLMNMIDANYASDKAYCVGDISLSRIITSIIVMLIAVLYQFKTLL